MRTVNAGVACVMFFIAGCATNTAMTYNTTPPGAKIVATSGKEHGTSPVRVVFNWDSRFEDANGCLKTEGVTAKWVSGATTSSPEILTICQKGENNYSLQRPQDAPGLDEDLQVGNSGSGKSIAAMTYNTTPPGAKIVATSGKEHGTSPVRVVFDWDSRFIDANGCLKTEGVTAKWVSGATTSSPDIITICQKGEDNYSLQRPQDAPGLDEDLQIGNSGLRKSVAELIALSKNGRIEEKEAAFDELMALRPCTPEIAEAINNYTANEMNVRGKLVVADYLVSVKMGKYSVRTLIELLGDRDGGARVRAAKLLGLIGADAAEALPALRIVAKNDARRIERVAKNSIRTIEISNMISKN